MKIKNKIQIQKSRINGIRVILLALILIPVLTISVYKYLSIYRLGTNSNIYNTSLYTPDHLYKIDIYKDGNCMSRKFFGLPFGLDNDIVTFRVYDKDNNNVANYIRISCVYEIGDLFMDDNDCECIVYWWHMDNDKPIYINPSRIEKLITNSIDKILN